MSGSAPGRLEAGAALAQVCQNLVDIAGYAKYYEVIDLMDGETVRFAGLDKEAGEWAMSENGQVAIIARGGRSLLRRHLVSPEPPPSASSESTDDQPHRSLPRQRDTTSAVGSLAAVVFPALEALLQRSLSACTFCWNS